MNKVPDLYAILEVPKDANEEQIKISFRHLAKKLHPDVCKEEGATEHFKLVKEAYRILSDPKSRMEYELDLKRQEEKEASSYTFHKVYDTLFSTPVSGVQPIDGRHIEVAATFSARDLFLNNTKKINVKRHKKCIECNTKRFIGGKEACKPCGGFGSYYRTISTPFGKIDTLHLCDACKGYGRSKAFVCPTCNGSGETPEDYTLPIKIERDFFDGKKVRVIGEGEPGKNGGIPGDLIITFNFQDTSYIVKNNDLECLQKVTFEDWLYQKPINCSMPDGTVQSFSLGKFQNDDMIIVPEYGLYDADKNQYSSLYFKIQIQLPDINERQTEVIKSAFGNSN